MKQCDLCKANFANEDAYQIHLGVGAPAFHSCNDASAMTAKSMEVNQDGVWSIESSLVVHQYKQHKLGYWARLKTELANPDDWE